MRGSILLEGGTWAGGQELGSRYKEGCLGWEAGGKVGMGTERERERPPSANLPTALRQLSQPFDVLLILYNISLALKSALILIQLLISFLSLLAGNLFYSFPCKGSVSLFLKRVFKENVSALTERHLSSLTRDQTRTLCFGSVEF